MNQRADWHRFILASASPRRKLLLENIGLEFEVYISDIDEHVEENMPVEIRVMELSRLKAASAAARFADAVVIAADTLVSVGGKVLGKPESRDEAAEMLLRLSGRKHDVYTGVTVALGGEIRTGYELTEVYFKGLTAREIDRYIDTGEPMDKAGAYGIQERGALMVKKINGDYFNVMGLPLHRMAQLLSELGVCIF